MQLTVLSEWHAKFDDLRRRRDITESDFAKATWEHLRALREHLGRGETVLIEWAADAFLERHQLMVERGSCQYRELCSRFCGLERRVFHRQRRDIQRLLHER